MSSHNSEIHPPASFQKLLMVTKESSICKTPERLKPPSDLLARLDAFLPEMARANSALLTNASPNPDTVETIVVPSSQKADIKVHSTTRSRHHADMEPDVTHQCESGLKSTKIGVSEQIPEKNGIKDDSRDATEDQATLLEMDLFVDNSLGQLVPSAEADKKLPKDSLIREIDMTAFAALQTCFFSSNTNGRGLTEGLKQQRYSVHTKTVEIPCATASNQAKTERRSLSRVNVTPFDVTVADKAGTEHPLTRRAATTLQINIGLTCNLACRHCHVESSPSRTETMPHFVAERLIELAAAEPSLQVVDITGGAPEMHNEFRFLVETFSRQGLSIIDRCNLAVLLEPNQRDLVSFLARHRVRIIASLPCYSATNVEAQRGDGAFDASIRALRMLNEVGYGHPESPLKLDLVYNPIGPTLPPPQLALEADYKRELKNAFDIDFSSLICITNMPIKRFADDLLIRGNLHDYMSLLVNSFNPSTVDSVMCRDMVHVAWNGLLYDCDFNYALDMVLRGPKSLESGQRKPLSIFDVQSFSELVDKRIATGKHCYGCTAGTGSSCGGSLS